jgi:predicted nucleotidyltransferase
MNGNIQCRKDMQTLNNLSTSLKASLGDFCKELSDRAGDRLSSVVLYGGAAKKGEFRENTSDLNVMIVLSKVDIETLDSISPVLQKANYELSVVPFILTEKELQSSAEVFAIKFADIKKYHVLLWGRDLLPGLQIAKEHLDFLCRQELKNLLMRLKQFYVFNYSLPEKLDQKLKKSFASFLVQVNTLLYIKTGATYETKPEIIAHAAGLPGFDKALMEKLLALKKDSLDADPAELKQLYADFMGLVKNAIATLKE